MCPLRASVLQMQEVRVESVRGVIEEREGRVAGLLHLEEDLELAIRGDACGRLRDDGAEALRLRLRLSRVPVNCERNKARREEDGPSAAVGESARLNKPSLFCIAVYCRVSIRRRPCDIRLGLLLPLYLNS